MALVLFGFSWLPPAGTAQATKSAERELTLKASCGTLNLTAIAPNALRVRCSVVPSSLPELVYTKTEPSNVTIGADAHVWWIRTEKIRATVDRQSMAIRFYDADGKLLTEEVPNSRSWSNSSAQTGSNAGAGVSGTAEVSFKLEPSEHLYGSGQFQDGYLNIARLPRKLVQLNTQIAIPFFLSSRGYGLLWHQYSMTALNEPANRLALAETGAGQSVSVDVTTSPERSANKDRRSSSKAASSHPKRATTPCSLIPAAP